MNIEPLGEISLPHHDDVAKITRLYSEITPLLDWKILVKEMEIHGENTDIAWIDAYTSTPVQSYEGDGEIVEILVHSCEVPNYDTLEEPLSCPVGVILMSPDGNVASYIYNPLRDGGPRGYKITKGWTMQTVILPGCHLVFFDYWTPKGFCNDDGKGQMYGPQVLHEVSDPEVLEKFSSAHAQLMNVMQMNR